ncbi:MAG: SRPBCC family protein [Pseudomonadales bacterium]|nr:SRPBCC family protein [Pseudomonadales bacterium]
MNINKSIVINASAAKVWKVVAEDFDRAYEWMSPVYHSRATHNQPAVGESPYSGRVCDLSSKENGLQADEIITAYNTEQKTFTFEVVPLNVPAVFPVDKNIVTIQLKAAPNGGTILEWQSSPQLKPHGYLLYPLLVLGFNKAFGDILQELKYFVEEGLPHPRNQKTKAV